MSRSRSWRRIAEKAYWREADAQVVLEAWRQSGDSLAAFARRHGLERARLTRWRSRLARPTEEPALRFHAVRLKTGSVDLGDVGSIEFELAGVRVRVGRAVDAGDLRTVVDVLESRGC